MYTMSSNLVPFSVDLILGNKKKSGGDKSGKYGGGGDLIMESLVLAKTVLLILQFEVLHCHARGASFLKMRSYSTNSLNQTRRCFLFHHPKSNSTIS
jgi:hypothetical protein